MHLVGRQAELEELTRLLDRAGGGAGGLLVLAGPPGSGRTVLADAAVGLARRRGFDVVRAAAIEGRPGRAVWAGLLRDVGAPEALAAAMLAEPGSADLDEAAHALCGPRARLLVVDHVDRGGRDAVDLLAALAGRLPAGPTAVLVTSTTPLGVGREQRVAPLTAAEVGELTGEHRPAVRRALWLAGRGLPGAVLPLGRTLAALPPDRDGVVELALLATSVEGFLEVDDGLIRLLEEALPRATAPAARARLLARLAYALLGDAAAAGRRRELVDEAVPLARQDADPAVLAEVLDARLYALWDPAGAADRLSAAAEIVALARESADPARERRGLLWRFIALVELARLTEAESALAAFERAARAAGDAAGIVMAMARHAMLGALRGRFDEAERLVDQLVAQGSQIGLPDTRGLEGTLRGLVARDRGDAARSEADVAELRAVDRRVPGQFYDATVARILLSAGRPAEAGLELDRALPAVLAGSGPRWLGAATDLAAVAAATGDTAAASQLAAVLDGYRGRLVAWAGAVVVTGPVAYYLGLLAGQLGRPDAAVELLTEAAELNERIAALPRLAETLAALADALDRRRQAGDGELADEHRRRARSIAHRLGMHGLLVAAPPDRAVWTLRRDGADWLLTAGEERARLRDGHGMHYLRALLAHPDRDIPALDLVAGGAGLAAPPAAPALDQAALAAYRKRLVELDAQVAAADRAGDADLAEQAERERQAVLAEVRRATGLGGRQRLVSAEAERARVNVTRTLRAAVDRIAELAPRAGAHLAASVRTGRACRYSPAPGGPTGWKV